VNNISAKRPAGEWQIRKPYSLKTAAVILLILFLLPISGKNVGIDKGLADTAGAVGAMFGYGESGVVDSVKSFIRKCFPLVVYSETEVNRIEGFDADNLPWLSHVETRTSRNYSALTNSWTESEIRVLVQPVGYALRVAWKMLETIEMAIWGTILSLIVSIPLAYFGAKNLAPGKPLYLAARGISSFNRSIPDIIFALFFVLMYGFGPLAGILSLGVHTSGFLGKFFADEIENSDPNTQEALASRGANKIQVLRYAILPQVMPQFFSYLQYILERNVRMATVLGIVGAGGIGMELKGRWDMFNYGHVSTILVAIFMVVVALEFITQQLRARLF
jgi:phosphonate transport system permease protein